MDVFFDVTDAILQTVVISFGDTQESHVIVSQGSHSAYDVIGRHGDVLDTRAAVEIDVLFDLTLATPLRRFVDGKLDAPRVRFERLWT